MCIRRFLTVESRGFGNQLGFALGQEIQLEKNSSMQAGVDSEKAGDTSHWLETNCGGGF